MTPTAPAPVRLPAPKRAPLPFPLWYFALALGGHCVGAVQNLVIGFGGGALTAAQHRDVLVWGALSVLGYGIALLASPLWSRLHARGLDAPTWRNWLAFSGLFLAFGLLGGAARSGLALAWMPALSSGRSALVGFALNIGLINLFTALTMQAVGLYYSRQLEHNRARRRLAAELAASRAAMVAADDQLRRELAELLHGKVQTHLVAAWALLGQSRARRAEPEAAARLLGRAAECLHGVQRESLPRLRDLLAPSQASPLSQLHAQVEHFRALLPVRWVVEGDYAASAPCVAPRLTLLGARLLEEALLNAFRHARARVVTVRVGPDAEGRLVIRVEDDGVGFRPEEASRGLGWSGLRGGLEELGGSLALRTAPGRGTTVTISLPTLPREQAVAA